MPTIPSHGLVVRALRRTDGAALRALYARNLAHLAAFLPAPPEEPGGDRWLRAELAQRAAGTRYPYVVVDRGAIVGTIALYDVSQGDARQADISFWIDADARGRGLATAAVTRLRHIAGVAIGLHRLVGATQLTNGAAQRVLEKNRFVLIGRAREYRYIAGRWHDHLLFERLLRNEPPPEPAAPSA